MADTLAATVAAAHEQDQAELRPARRVVWALARAEGGRQVRHPATLVGLLLSSLLVWATLRDVAPVLHREATLVAGQATALAAGVFLAANLAALRARRDRTDELYGCAPTEAVTRTAAHLLAGLWPACLALAWTGAAVAYLYVLGGIWAPEPFDVLGVPALVGLAAVAGVALARWLPSPFAGPVALVAVAATQMWLVGNAAATQRLRLWADWGPNGAHGLIETWPRDPLLHLGYVTAVAGVLACAAILRQHRSVRLLLASGAASVVAVAAVAGLLSPQSHDRDRTRTIATDPEGVQVCERHGGVTYCTLPAYRGWIGRWRPVVEGVLASLAQGSAPRGLRVQLDHRDLGPLSDDRTVRVSSSQARGPNGDTQQLSLALRTVQMALDFGGVVAIDAEIVDELGAGGDGAACSLAGQAREVVALYLAARASPAAERALRRNVAEQPYGLQVLDGGSGISWNDDLNLFDHHSDPNTSARWTRGAATLARQLLDRERDEVLERIYQGWVRWTDSTTTSDDLVVAFGLDALPTPEEQALAAGIAPDRVAFLTDPQYLGPPTPPCP